ncbi:hypothetical protein [Vibrio phage XZ1]|uniref:Uncharacterized protein n=1 Tax=Vibrio phage ValKK3 TaxID=1610855 RepID=A0A0D4DB90_9CAUD|nr:hypothetical protein AVU32_gp240 [Vibrio phage ValKK3]AJT61081.1 hypothetical protein [Vibrio phage ValKK3]UOL51467.1 hypothetical protein [Vibrio phage XZ1]
MSNEDDLLDTDRILNSMRIILTDERVESALRLDVARDQEEKEKMINARKATLGQIQDQQHKIESKLELLHDLLNVKREIS